MIDLISVFTKIWQAIKSLVAFGRWLENPFESALKQVESRGNFPLVWIKIFRKWFKTKEFAKFLHGSENLTIDDIYNEFIIYGRLESFDPVEMKKFVQEVYAEWNIKTRMKNTEFGTRQSVRAETQIFQLIENQNTMQTQLQRLDAARNEPILQDDNSKVSDKFKSDNDLVDQAKQLIQNGQIVAARQLLLGVRSRIETLEGAEHLKFRVFTNLSQCSLIFAEYDRAHGEATKALDNQPDNPKALANMAQVLLFLEKYTTALPLARRAHELDPSDGSILATYLACLSAASETNELANSIFANRVLIEKSASCQMALGQNAYENQNFESAKAHFKAARELDAANTEALISIARSIYRPLRIAAMESSINEQETSEDQIALSEATKLCTKAINELKDTTNSLAKIHARELRSCIRFIQRKNTEGIQDCNIILEDFPNRLRTRIIKSQHLTMLNEFRSVLNELEDYILSNLSEFWEILGYSLYRLKKFGEAVKVLRPYVQVSTANPLTIVYCQSLAITGETKEAYEIAKSFRERGKYEPVLLMAEMEYLRGRPDIADLEQALLVLDILIPLQPNIVDYQINRASINCFLQRRETAIRAIELVDQSLLKDDPEALQAFLNVVGQMKKNGWIQTKFKER